MKLGCCYVVLFAPLSGGVAEGEHEFGRAGFERERPVVLGGGFRDPLLRLLLSLVVCRLLGFDDGKFFFDLRGAPQQETFAFHQLLIAQHHIPGINHRLGQMFHLLLGLVEVVLGQPPALMGGLAVTPIPQPAEHPGGTGIPVVGTRFVEPVLGPESFPGFFVPQPGRDHSPGAFDVLCIIGPPGPSNRGRDVGEIVR